MGSSTTVRRLWKPAIELGRDVLSKFAGFIDNIGVMVFYVRDVIVQAFRRPFRIGLIFKQIDFIGFESLSIILLTGFFTGAVFSLQIGGIFVIFKAEGMMGGATGLALATELAPLVTGFLITGRAGSAMTAEIATMKVNEQVDAMEAMAVHPIHYLVVPRVIASVIIMPFLCGIFMFVGTVGAYVTGVVLFNVDPGVFFEKLVELVGPEDVISGLRKMLFFSAIISAVSCWYGLKASGGAKGVGIATTDSVVRTLLGLLITDFVISYIQIRWLT